MKVKVHYPTDTILNGKVTKLLPGECDVPHDVAQKLIKNGVASLPPSASTAKAQKSGPKGVADEI